VFLAGILFRNENSYALQKILEAYWVL
jgi:hypothetical protein